MQQRLPVDVMKSELFADVLHVSWPSDILTIIKRHCGATVTKKGLNAGVCLSRRTVNRHKRFR